MSDFFHWLLTEHAAASILLSVLIALGVYLTWRDFND
jgi:hypothetical protein